MIACQLLIGFNFVFSCPVCFIFNLQGAVSAIFLITAVVAANLPVVVLGQMAYYNQHNNFYDAQQTEYCQNKGVYGSARDCGYGTKNQNWFGYYYLGKRYPYELGSNLPYGL